MIAISQRLRERERIVGYWVMSDSPAATERIAAVGYDYVCFDLQHGLLDYTGALRGVMAAELGGAVGVVRVPANEPAWIGRALDAGARAVIVPLVDSPRDAAAAARACRYPPAGTRSYGPARSGLTVGTDLRGADERGVHRDDRNPRGPLERSADLHNARHRRRLRRPV
jgi:4-hydroxy-2-oxoheptanedioate aldolase